MKLQLGDQGTRRIPLKKLWNESTSTISYSLLTDLAIAYSSVSGNKDDFDVVTTYTDEDGDEIVISSDEELVDAFEQFIDKVPPVVRAKASVKSNKVKAATARTAATTTKDATTSKRNVCKKGRACRTAPQTLKNKADSQTKPDVPLASDSLERDFIHGRHTCDGCLTTPIIGPRYHAENKTDYDLCQSCYTNYQGDTIFIPAQLDRDRHLQNRWRRRQMRRARPVPTDVSFGSSSSNRKTPCRGAQTQRVIDSMDAGLKEAIRRSLVDTSQEIKKKEEDIVVDKPKEQQQVKDSELNKMNKIEVVADETDGDKKVQGGQTNDNEINANDLHLVEEVVPLLEAAVLPVEELATVTVRSESNREDDISSTTFEEVNDTNNDEVSFAETVATQESDKDISECGSSKTKDEWEVLTTDDEMIAQAAQMLGSALFQSDTTA